MSTEAQRKASAAFMAKRQAEGWRKQTFWTSPQVTAELERLKAIHGTRDKALEALILGSAKFIVTSGGSGGPGAAFVPEGPEKPPVTRKAAVAKAPAAKPGLAYGARLDKKAIGKRKGGK